MIIPLQKKNGFEINLQNRNRHWRIKFLKPEQKWKMLFHYTNIRQTRKPLPSFPQFVTSSPGLWLCLSNLLKAAIHLHVVSKRRHSFLLLSVPAQAVQARPPQGPEISREADQSVCWVWPVQPSALPPRQHSLPTGEGSAAGMISSFF